MMYPLIYATILPILFLKQKENPVPKEYAFPLVEKVLHISPPPGFHRKQVEPGSFAYWLRNVTLKTDKTVYLYNGALKKNQDAQYAVLDITTGEEDLQQCADAVIRLRAEYLFYHCRFNEIIFFDNQKKKYQFMYPYSRSNFEQYLKKVFNWCGTLSLEKQLRAISENALVEAGDVYIHGGSPGHAVIIIDIVENEENEKLFLLAQGYMPAQDMHILKNPTDPGISPWYKLPKKDQINTPEWVFYKKERKKW